MVHINKGSDVKHILRCRLVAQDFGYGVKDDELYAGTPSLATMKQLLSTAASTWTEDSVIMVFDAKCAFLYGKARRKIYIELPTQDERSGGQWVGILFKAMYGASDDSVRWRATVDEAMKDFWFQEQLVTTWSICS